MEISLTTTIKRENLRPVWDKPVPELWLSFWPNFLLFVDHIWFLLEKSYLKNLGRINCLGWNFGQCGRIRFTLTKAMNKLIRTKKSSFYFIGWSFRNWKIAAFLHLVKNWNISTQVWQDILCVSKFPTSLQCLAKGNWKSSVCAKSKLWIFWFDKK